MLVVNPYEEQIEIIRSLLRIDQNQISIHIIIKLCTI